MSPRPPRLAEILLARCLPPQDRDDLLGDLAELHASTVRAWGAPRAHLHYWREAMALVWQARVSPAIGAGRSRRALSGLRNDLLSAIRLHRRLPGQSVVALVTLALALGMTTAVLSAARALVFNRLPTPAPQEVVRIDETERGAVLRSLSEPDLQDWRAARHIFGEVAAYSTAARALTGLQAAERISMADVDDAFFPLFRVHPVAGRLVTAADMQPGVEPVVVLSERFWRTRFGADPAAVGRQLTLDFVTHRIVGVAPDAFAFPEGAQLWTSLRVAPMFKDRRFHLLAVIGRLAGGMTLARARDAADAVAADLARRDPAVHAQRGVAVTPLQEDLTRDVRTPVHFLSLAAALVLLVACTNVSGIMLTRTADRWREFGTRAAMGATRWRLCRQIALEVLALMTASAALGVLIAYGATDALRRLAPVEIAPRDRITVDVEILGWCLLTAATAALITTLAPAVRVARMVVADALGGGARAITSRRFGRHLLVAIQMSAAIALLVCGLLLARSFNQVARVDPGFRAQGAAIAPLRLPLQKYPKKELYRPVFEGLLARVSQADGVSSAALAFVMPLTTAKFEIEVRVAEPPGRPGQEVLLNTVTRDYFRTMQIPLLRGRTFGDEDSAVSPAVAIVSERLAETMWGRADVLGEWLHGGQAGERWQVVGVVADVKDRDLTVESRPMVYRPFSQFSTNTATLVARSARDPGQLIAELRTIITTSDRDIPVDAIAPLQSLVDRARARARFVAALVGAFAAVAVGIAVIGLYAAIGYTVQMRRPELGLRLALGATPVAIAREVCRDVAVILAVGLIAGGAGGFAGGQLIRQLLFNVAPWDTSSFVATAVLVVGAGALASMSAIRSALDTDPARALYPT